MYLHKSPLNEATLWICSPFCRVHLDHLERACSGHYVASFTAGDTIVGGQRWGRGKYNFLREVLKQENARAYLMCLIYCKKTRH